MLKGCVLLSILSHSCAVKVAKISHREALAAFSENVFDPDSEDPDVGSTMQEISGHVDLASALDTVQRKDLPPPVTLLLQSAGKGEMSGHDEVSLGKAREALNSLVEKAWVELDDKILKCKGFQEMNRENFAQVNRDLSRLDAQINDLTRLEAESIDGSGKVESELVQTHELLSQAEQNHKADYAANEDELRVRKNDLEVFQLVLEHSKCDAGVAFLQYQVCQLGSGRRTLFFQDQLVAKRFKAMLLPSSRQSLNAILGEQHPSGVPVFFQMSNIPVVGEDGLPCDGDEDDCMKSCRPIETPECGSLHDKVSLLWGEAKDGVDDLTMEMSKSVDEWNEHKASLNMQISLLSQKKARYTTQLAEARSNLASDRQEKKEKLVEKKALDEEYQAYMTQCKRRIEWIMHQEMCSIKVVRDALMGGSSQCPTSEILDCSVGAWVQEECSASCDDSCDPRKPFECGGWREMKREVVASNDACGIRCPALSKYMRCAQYHCPGDCEMSSWSGWSACSANCEGGVQVRTRSVLLQAKNGGERCNGPEESRSCNTQSCDRDCKLARWTRWSPCSVACGGGVQQIQRHVLVPTRGEGRCPGASSRQRYRERQCNTHACEGDEVCKALQDLVVAVDSSGSLQQRGFDVLKRFAETLISRYQTTFYGRHRVKIGLCQFGNGEVGADGRTISPAIEVTPLTFEKAQVLQAVRGLVFRKGFTNLAQAFATAEEMLARGSRKGAQQAVLLITDGQNSQPFETESMVRQLHDKGIMRYFVVVDAQGTNSNAMTRIKAWSSQPWSTNVVHVPGLEQLEGDVQMWAQKALTKFCPLAYSPGAREEFEHVNGLQRVFRGGWCRGIRWRWAGKVSRSDQRRQCKDKALEKGSQVFLLRRPRWLRVRRRCRGRRGRSRGRVRKWCYDRRRSRWAGCYTGDMQVSPTQYADWFRDKENPQCSAGKRNHWRYDMYALYPKDDQVCKSMGIQVSGDADCTGKDVWHWQGGSHGFSADDWATESFSDWGGTGTCVTYATTNGMTCKEYCESFGRACARGQDDAHHQVAQLNYWLRGRGQSGTKCTAYDEGHGRQTTAENGCLQKWGTQLCACK